MRIRFCIWACMLGLLVVGGCKKDSSPRHYADGEVRVLMKNNPDGPNIVILGDGYTKDDLVVNGDYDIKVKLLVDYLFNTPPFNRYKNVFNVYQVYAISTQRGARDSFDVNSTATKFNTFFTKNNRSVQTGNYDTLYKYVEKVMPMWQAHLPVMLVNDSRYGGTGGGLATVSTGVALEPTFVHEAGHTFAFLGDEYVETVKEKDYPLSVTQFYPNLDTVNNPATVKWSHYFNRQRYKGIIGAFEGGMYYAKGVYRPEENSVMRDNYRSRYFNAPSREAIVRRIYEIMGKQFDLEAYVREDMNTMGYALQPETDPNFNLPPLTADHIKPLEQLKMMKQQRQYREQQNRIH